MAHRMLPLLLLAWPVLAAAGYQEGLTAYQKGDYRTAYSEWQVAAEQGHAESQYRLGTMYEAGAGVPSDFLEASRWYRKAARQGHTSAQHMVGLTYAYGLGVPRDLDSAHMWFNLAADGGDPNAGDALTMVAARMSPEQIADARRLALEWQPTP